MRIIVILLVGIMLLKVPVSLKAQAKTVRGQVVDKQSDEPIPFASVFFKIRGNGVLTDSLGKFILPYTQVEPTDSLIISSVGYIQYAILAASLKDSSSLNIQLVVKPPQQEAVVKAKYNRALWFWRKIIKNKDRNNRSRWDNYSYELYNKLELDLDNVNKEKLGKTIFLKKLNFVLDYVDTTSEDKPYLPVYLTETLSDYYYQKSPNRVREYIKATRTNGIDNQSIIKQLGGTYQNVNVLNNFIPVFNREFISPFNDHGDNYYNFKLLDTQYLANRRLIHFKFSPKHKGESTFDGDAWVHDTTFAIQKITLRPALDANVNFITNMSLIQEYRLINDSTWFLSKDKFVADISIIGSRPFNFKGRKTTTYRNVVVDSQSVLNELAKSKAPEDIIVAPNSAIESDSFWAEKRHEPLNKNEQTVYLVLDTLTKNPTYIKYRNTVNFLTTGTKDIGNIRIGPWWYWISGNAWEGTRMRFDVATNSGFNKHLNLRGYLAYGFNDGKFKGKGEALYRFNTQPWSYVSASYKNDLDNGVTYYDQLGTDNIFAYIFRRPSIPFKFQKNEEFKTEYYQETNKGFGFGLTVSTRRYTPLENLPDKQYYINNVGEPLKTFETGLRFRYAFKERVFEDNFNRYSLGSDFPIVELRLAKGWPGVLNSSYEYTKVDLMVSDYMKISPYGSLYYNVFAGKVYGTLPYQLLQIAPGNEMFYFNRYAFNLMNRFEYITDHYAGFNVEHNIGNGLFRFIPLTRKLKFRQFWNAKGLIGDLSDANRQLNFVGDYPFKSLNGRWYMELGTGVDNIFKFFRVDFLWRWTANGVDVDPARGFGIFGSFRVTF